MERVDEAGVMHWGVVYLSFDMFFPEGFVAGIGSNKIYHLEAWVVKVMSLYMVSEGVLSKGMATDAVELLALFLWYGFRLINLPMGVRWSLLFNSTFAFNLYHLSAIYSVLQLLFRR